MQHHHRRLDPRGGLEGFQGVTPGVLALAGVGGGKLVKIGGGVIDAHGQGTKIVEGGDLDFAGVHRLDDAGEQADADAVAEFRAVKAQGMDFPQHGASIGMAMGIPAS